MGEQQADLWAPWRMAYIRTLTPKGDPECFVCKYRDEVGREAQNHVVQRSDRCIVLMNKFPYTNGHLLVAPLVHQPDLHELEPETLLEFTALIRDWVHVVTTTVHAHGMNVGMNLGRCAGAGLPGHVHMHIVPRWDGDTSFMTVLSDTRVIPQDLDELYALLVTQARRLGYLPPGD